MIKRKICFVTGSRAEYGLLYQLIKEIDEDQDLKLQIIATGMHLSEDYGNTFKQIEEDGFTIDKKVDIALLSDTEMSISKSIGIGVEKISKSFNEIKPDLIVVLGDRYEIFSAAIAAMIIKIPLAHIHGGEATEGLIDEPIRHSITKMSHLHFTATNDYRNRVIQLGEQPDKVFNFGGIGIDNIYKLDLLERDNFEKKINFKLGKKNILVTFHPVTLEKSTSKIHFQELLNSISDLKDTKIIFTKANSDIDGRIINQMIDEYVSKNDSSIAFKSMGQLNYLSALQFVDAVVGNSSSGIIEAPSFKIGTVNIGDRQKGRIKAISVINCLPNKENIDDALLKLYSKEFNEVVSKVINPYGNGGASIKIAKVLKSANLENIIKKSFYDFKAPSL